MRQRRITRACSIQGDGFGMEGEPIPDEEVFRVDSRAHCAKCDRPYGEHQHLGGTFYRDCLGRLVKT